MNISKILSVLALCVGISFLSAPEAEAQVRGQGGNMGIGVMLGEPTGISFKVWNNERSAFDLGAAWSFGGYDAIHIHGDYLLHNWLNEVEEGDLAFYYGIGARTILSNDARLGIRVPVGLNYIVPDSKIDLFVEAVPILDLVPGTEFSGNGALGVRYFF